MFTSSDGYILGSIDVGDAYLMVEQDEPTVVEVDGKYYELGSTLPGQRVPSSAWFNKLQGILEKYGLKSDDGLPALFYAKTEEKKGGQFVLSHVDDVDVFARKSDFEALVKSLKDEGLKIKVEGPLDVESRTMSFLKRVFRSMGDGSVEVTINSKYIEGLVEVLELGEAFPKKVPCLSDGGRAFKSRKGGEDSLSSEDHHIFRKGVGILLYLALERPDITFVLKKLSTIKLSSPTNSDVEMLRHIGKYLKGTPEISLVHKRSFPGTSFQDDRNIGESWKRCVPQAVDFGSLFRFGLGS